MSPPQNHLIERLSAKDRQQLLGPCTVVELAPSQVLFEPGVVSQHAYFPTDGFVAIEVAVDQHPALEVAMVGREGMVGAHLVLGVPFASTRAVVQGSGAAWRIGTRSLHAELARSEGLQRGLNSYVGVVLAQYATAVACRRFHEIGPRLARWLLMSQDRTPADAVEVTHEVLARLLGVRRVGVTMAAGELQRLGLIAYHRGHVSVLDRPGLESAACSCYAADGRSYAARLDG